MIGGLLSAIWAVAGWLLSAIWAVAGWLLSPVPIVTIAITVATLYFYITRNYNFWPSRGVPGPPGGTYLGNTMIEVDLKLYRELGGKRYCGWIEMGRPALHVGDPDLIRDITIKDFEHFADRRHFTLSDDFRHMLTVLNGPKWKATRAVMSPSFSASKLKGMHQLCLDNAAKLVEYLREEMAQKDEVEMKNSFGRFTMDNIAACAFGVDCNSFVDPNTEFAKQATVFFKPFRGYSLIRIALMMMFSDRLARWLPDPYKASNDFFKRVVSTTIEHREKSGTTRRDFLQLLLETKDKDGNRVLTNDSIVMQSVLFFFAGYDTTATLLTFAAYSLATSPECQEKVQEEIDAVLERHGGQLTYEAVMEMTYLDRVLSETLRLYPPALRLERQCSKDYTLSGTNVNIPAGLVIQMNVLGIHRDPDHYPDPLRFDPDRFLPEEKEKRHPCAYLPFGSGPRNCIAMRFALFEAKVALAAVLQENTLTRGPRTPDPPLPYDETAFMLKPKGGAFLKLVARG